jgi:hypothetical protein
MQARPGETDKQDGQQKQANRTVTGKKGRRERNRKMERDKRLAERKTDQQTRQETRTNK